MLKWSMNVKLHDGTLATDTWAKDARAQTLRDAMRAGRAKCETAHEEISRLHRERLPTLTGTAVKTKLSVCESLASAQRNEHIKPNVLGDQTERAMLVTSRVQIVTATTATTATKNFTISWEPEEHILQKKLIEDYLKRKGKTRLTPPGLRRKAARMRMRMRR
mmetsp:Transcript_20137/g.50253  ORF Transcript_20137/g.50253 Transcript_20137/m.50253 type:complete len:163 (-) Transcript_20137:340-828(-)